MSNKTSIILGIIWCLAEIAIISVCTWKFGWVGFGITFGICFAVRVAIFVAARIIGHKADKAYYETFHPSL